MTPEACRGLSVGVLRSGLRSVKSVKVQTQVAKLVWDPQRFTMAMSEVCKRWQTDIIKSDPERSQLVSLFQSFLRHNWFCEPWDREYWTSKG